MRRLASLVELILVVALLAILCAMGPNWLEAEE